MDEAVEIQDAVGHAAEFASMDMNWMYMAIVAVIAVGGLLFAWYLKQWVEKQETGPAEMRKISDAIKEGAEAFLKRQNTTIIYLAAGVTAILFIMFAFVRSHRGFDPVDLPIELGLSIAGSFIFGALCSVFAGYIGMYVSIRANIRVANAALTSLKSGHTNNLEKPGGWYQDGIRYYNQCR